MKKERAFFGRYVWVGMAAAMVFCGACVADDGKCDPTVGGALRIRPTLQTRVTSTHFESGDAIGVTLYLSTGGTHFENVRFGYDGTLFTAESASWPTEESGAGTLVAYYPYAGSGQPTRFAVQRDQRGEGYEASDLLAASTSVTPTEEPVPLTFYHLFARLEIETEVPETLTIETLSIGGFATEAAIDLQARAATIGASEAEEVTAHETTANRAYCAVFPPQEGMLEVEVQTSRATSTKRIAGVKFEAGKSYTLRLKLSEESRVIDSELSGDIRDWATGGEIGGETGTGDVSESDPGEDGGSQQGEPVPGDEDPGTVVYGGVSYRTQESGGRRWLAENLRYVPAGAQAARDYYYPNNDPAEADRLGLLYSYATASGGICPAGWRLPTIGELTALAAAVEKSFFSDSGFFATSDGATYNTKGSYLVSSSAGTSEAEAQYLYIPLIGDAIEAVSRPTANIAASVRCVQE